MAFQVLNLGLLQLENSIDKVDRRLIPSPNPSPLQSARWAYFFNALNYNKLEIKLIDVGGTGFEPNTLFLSFSFFLQITFIVTEK